MIKNSAVYKWVGIVILASLALLIVAVFIDARELLGLKLEPSVEAEYKATLRGEEYIVRYRPKEAIAPFFGNARNEFGTGYALVRDDLPKSAQKFVMYHEIYHLQDETHRNIISREIHANLAALPYAPFGFLQTVFLTFSDPERIRYYFQLVF